MKQYFIMAFHLALLGFFNPAQAQQVIGEWDLGSNTVESGRVRHYASRHSSNMIQSSEVPDYAPLYVISCLTSENDRWSQSVELEDHLTSAGPIMLNVTLDAGKPQQVLWTVDPKRKKLVRSNRADIAVLRKTQRMTISWNWGWSWLWLSDEVQIDLSEINAVVYALSKQCAIPEP